MNLLRFSLRSIIFMDLPWRVPDRCMGDAIAREPKRKRPNPNRDRTEVCDLMPVRFQGMTPVSDGDKKTSGGLIPQRSDAPSAHRRPGYSLSGCTPAQPDSASPGAGSIAELQEPVTRPAVQPGIKALVSSARKPRHGRVVATWVRMPLQKFNRIWASP